MNYRMLLRAFHKKNLYVHMWKFILCSFLSSLAFTKIRLPPARSLVQRWSSRFFFNYRHERVTQDWIPTRPVPLRRSKDRGNKSTSAKRDRYSTHALTCEWWKAMSSDPTAVRERNQRDTTVAKMRAETANGFNSHLRKLPSNWCSFCWLCIKLISGSCASWGRGTGPSLPSGKCFFVYIIPSSFQYEQLKN